MAGGGGITGVDYIGEVAKPDEVTAGYFTGSLFHHQTKTRDSVWISANSGLSPASRCRISELTHRRASKKRQTFPYLSFNAEHDLYRLQARATGQFAASDPYEPRAMLPCDSLQLQLVDDTWH
jgi:hypothetical protein